MNRVISLASIIWLTSFSAGAEIKINGFANIVGGITSSDDQLLGYDDNISFSNDSLFAIQLSGNINERMTATGQILARGIDDYDAEVAWAYLTYEVTDNLNLSVGRIRLPSFRYSDSADVGYSYHWITPPSSVYSGAGGGGFNIEGLSARYNNFAGDWEYGFQVVAGSFESEVAGANTRGDNIVFFVAEGQREWLKIRGVVGRIDLSIDLPDLEPTLQTLSSISPQLSDALRTKDDSGLFLGLALDTDFQDWFISSEYTFADVEDSFSAEDKSFYISAGVRVRAFTPSITFESKRADELKFLEDVASLPTEVQPAALAIVTGIQNQGLSKYKLINLALRYDYDVNIALKAEVSRYNDELDDIRDATLVRFAINYVF